MHSHDPAKAAEADVASWEAAKGAAIGAAKWGAAAFILGAIGRVYSPIYRNTTIQFKVYVQMSGMILGGMIEADHRLRLYEYQMRMQRRVQRDHARLERLEAEYSRQDQSTKS